jgi:hypothetical protein
VPSPSIAATPAAQPQGSVPCPPAASALVDGFYRWFLASGAGRADFQSQRQRFTPELDGELRTAFALQPADGRYGDFDPFSNTQVASYGHHISQRIAGCRWDPSGLLLLRVEVLAGLDRARASNVPLDYLLRPAGASWRIADIRYPGEQSFSLRAYLQHLLQRP